MTMIIIDAVIRGFFGAAGASMFIWLNRKWIVSMFKKAAPKEEPKQQAEVYEIGTLRRSK